MLVAQKVTAGVYKGVTTTELDELAAETAASLTATHPDYAMVSGGGARVGAGCGREGGRATLRAPRLRAAARPGLNRARRRPPAAARRAPRRLQPAQEHAQVVQREVGGRRWWRWSALEFLWGAALSLPPYTHTLPPLR